MRKKMSAAPPSVTGGLLVMSPSRDSPDSVAATDLAMRLSKPTPIIQTDSSCTATSTPEKVAMLADQTLRNERMRVAAAIMHKLSMAIRLAEDDGSSSSGSDDDDDDDDKGDVEAIPLDHLSKRGAAHSLASAVPDQKRARSL